MPRSVWYALGGENGLIVNVESVILDSNSALFSEATLGTHVFLEPIGASTILNVYGWIANNFLSLFVDLGLNTSLEAGCL